MHVPLSAAQPGDLLVWGSAPGFYHVAIYLGGGRVVQASKAAYRGEKLTRKVWAEVQSADYVAQCYAPPSKRIVMQNDSPTEFKTDIRLYTYAGSTVLAAARLYQGQTTNMRTPGGGFAPVLQIYSAN